MKLTHVLALISLLGGLIYIFRNKEYQKSYIKYVLYVYPIIGLNLTSEMYGAISVFDTLTFITVIFSYKKILIIHKQYAVYTFLFIMLVILLIIGSLSSESKLNSIIYVIAFTPIFFYVKIMIDECRKDANLFAIIINGCRFSCIVSLIFLVLQIIIGTNITIFEGLNINVLGDGDGIRYPGMFMDSQLHAQFLAMSSFLFLLNKNSSSSPGLKNILLFMIVLLALLLSGGRSGLIGFACGLLILFLFLSNKFRIYIIIGFLFGLVIFPFFSNQFVVINRLNAVSDSYLFRHKLWELAYQIWLKKPYLGVGSGNYYNYVRIYSQDQYLLLEDNEILWLNQPESGYLKLLVELGIFSFIIYCLFLILPIAYGIWNHFRNKRNYEIYYYIASLTSWSFAFFTVYSFQDKRIIILVGTLIGLIMSKTTTVKNEQYDKSI